MDFRFVPALLLLILLSACGATNSDINSIANASAPCAPKTAQILVGDGYLRNVCGCQEASGTYAHYPQTLICTVPTSTTVFFNYQGATLVHQIVPVGQPSFPASPLSNPNASPAYPDFPVLFTTPGVYTFVDNQNSTLSGQVIVQ